MSNTYPTSIDTADNVADLLSFNGDGLIPAVAQQADTRDVLMMAWMNRDAVIETLSTGRVCYFSRSRKTLWRKGETSGQIQTLKDFRWDCDADTILLIVDQQGVACHTGRQNCFYNSVRNDKASVIAEILINPDDLYG